MTAPRPPLTTRDAAFYLLVASLIGQNLLIALAVIVVLSR